MHGSSSWVTGLRWVARVWAEVAIVGYLLWQAAAPSPVRGEGDYWERLASLALIAVIAVGHVVSWRWEIVGATVMAVGGALLAVLPLMYVGEAEVALGPRQVLGEALLTLLAFTAPAFLYWLIWRRGRPHRQVLGLAALLSALVASTSAAALAVFSVAYGPVHPASALAPLPDAAVVWQWSGPPTPDSTVVVARVRDPQAEAALAIGTDPELRDARLVPSGARAEDDPAVVRFDVAGLTPGTRYYYAVSVGAALVTERTGTLVTPTADARSVTFAIGSCILTGSNGSVFDQIRNQDPDLFIISGDFAYEDFWTDDRAAVRDMYDTQLTSPAIDALVRTVPTAYMWDDHDFGSNDADSTEASAPASQIVYRQRVPHVELPAGTGPEAIYQSFSWGGTRFILTDSRSERSPKQSPDDASKTMLGARQKQWLAAQLQQAAEAGQFVVLVTSVPWNGAATPGADDWAGYATERTEIADMIARAGLADRLLMIAGDAHMLAIDDGSNTDFTSDGTGGFPLLQAAALDQHGSTKAGPYSEGAHPGGGQFALVSIDGDAVQIRGLDYAGTELVSYSFTAD